MEYGFGCIMVFLYNKTSLLAMVIFQKVKVLIQFNKTAFGTKILPKL